MKKFWEEAFTAKKEMWGSEPAHAAMLTADLFFYHSFKSVLIPGIGYGRNAQPFINKGIEITGIEISDKAIELADNYNAKNRNHYKRPPLVIILLSVY